MSTITKSVEVDANVQSVYNQWTQFEDFPKFMRGVEEVQQLSDDTLHWKANILGREVEWDAVIDEQVPDRCIAWHSTTGESNSGRVEFQPVDNEHTRVTLTMSYEPRKTVERIGAAMGFVEGQVRDDLDSFKHFIEDRGIATGAWRGAIHH